MKKIVIIGAGGQLGQCLQKVGAMRQNVTLVPLAEVDADILDEDLLGRVLMREKPDFVINCAAYTAVDLAEDEQQLAKEINEIGALNLANACKELNCILIHISTDFVFEGNEVKLLTEQDLANPISVYGQTKLDGEIAIANNWNKHFTIRTSWLYSEFGNNFVKTMLKLGAERAELSVIADQVGTPTYAIDLADVLFQIIESGSEEYGLYHYSNEGVTSWYDFAKTIFEFGEITVKLNPIPGSAYPTKAKRPSFSVMDKSKIKAIFKLNIPYWRDSLEECINRLKNI